MVLGGPVLAKQAYRPGLLSNLAGRYRNGIGVIGAPLLMFHYQESKRFGN